MENDYKKGVIDGVLAFAAWGFLPLYWKLLKSIPALQIFAHRIFWSFIFLISIIIYQKKTVKLKNLFKDKVRMPYVVMCALLISCNWYLYIWSVNAGYVIEASLGYYINPLAVVLLGTLVLKEKLDHYQKIAFALAAVGVLNLTLNYGRFPWIALGLAMTFAFYGLAKKMAKADPILGLTIETIILAPIAFAYIVNNEISEVGILGNVSSALVLVVILSGVVTAIPLLWYSKATSAIPLSVVGFLQYIAPSISLFLGIFVFKETFTLTHFISFGFIWIGLAIYSFSQLKFYSNVKKIE